MRRSPAYSKYLEHNATVFPIPEIDWELQIEFAPVEEELKMIREAAGFVDYSFNNIIAVMGKQAKEFLQKLLVNDLNKIQPGRTIYSPLVDDKGSVIDEATVFCLKEDYFLYNGSIMKEVADKWLAQQALNYDVYLAYTGHCLLAVQGPKSRDILKNHIDIDGMNYFDVKEAEFKNIPLIVGRLGYSGEIGYELYCHYEQVGSLWDGLMDIGKDQGLGPYGLEATEILSIEKGYLTPTDFYEGSTPLELGLGWTVSFDKEDFFGKQALMERKEQGLKTRLVGFEVKDTDFTLESGLPLYKGNEKVGEVTQCGPGITVGKHFLARAWVDIDVAKDGEAIEVEKDGSRTTVNVILEKDWYDPGGKKLRG